MSTDRVTRFRYTQSDLERRLGLLRDNIVDLRERVRFFYSVEAQSISNWQTRLGTLEDQYLSLALSFYSYDYPMTLVQRSLACAAHACLGVFERRGTEPPFPVLEVTIDNRFPKEDPRHAVQKQRHPPDAKDHSVTNSRANFKGVCEAMASGELALASQLASLAWDPPDVNWISMRSEICTPNDQHLAYAIKHFFADDFSNMQSCLNKMRTGPRKDIQLAYVAGMLEAIVARNDLQFREWLGDLLDWHERHANSKQGVIDSELCLSGLAFSALAVKRGILPISELPQCNVYLPIDLIELSQTSELGDAGFHFETFDSLAVE